MNHIYLDHNATSPIDPLVADAVAECLHAGYMNPASQHHFGRRARKKLENVRECVGRILGASLSSHKSDQVIFTSGGTESNNLAILGLVGNPPGNIILSEIEHPSIFGAADQLCKRGFGIRRVRVSSKGIVDVDHLSSLIDVETQLVSIMLGNNETGVLQPVGEAAQICAQHGIPLHTDAVQVVGKLPVDFSRLGVVALSATAHKLHGPRGIGVLVIKHGVHLEPILFGGFQQMGLRPGTESIALAVGLVKALELWQLEAEARATRLARLRDHLEALIKAELPHVVVIGATAERLPHTSNCSFPGLDRQAILMALDQAGVACSTGSACASGSSEPSQVLFAMGCPKDVVEGSIRLSLGALTTETDIADAAQRIIKVIRSLGNKN